MLSHSFTTRSRHTHVWYKPTLKKCVWITFAWIIFLADSIANFARRNWRCWIFSLSLLYLLRCQRLQKWMKNRKEIFRDTAEWERRKEAEKKKKNKFNSSPFHEDPSQLRYSPPGELGLTFFPSLTISPSVYIETLASRLLHLYSFSNTTHNR